MNKTLTKKIFRDVRRANLKYKMVETGDRIAVGLSGGKDSTALLYFLSMLQQYTPLDFTLVPIYLDLGFDNDDSPLQQVCADLQLPLLVEKTNIGTIVFRYPSGKESLLALFQSAPRRAQPGGQKK
jgi:tRNA(Ile)-lysidine synthase TilS/MesJ